MVSNFSSRPTFYKNRKYAMKRPALSQNKSKSSNSIRARAEDCPLFLHCSVSTVLSTVVLTLLICFRDRATDLSKPSG